MEAKAFASTHWAYYSLGRRRTGTNQFALEHSALYRGQQPHEPKPREIRSTGSTEGFVDRRQLALSETPVHETPVKVAAQSGHEILSTKL
jgi:hypothetical protein